MTDKEAIDNLKNYIECLMEDYGYYKDIVEFRDSVEHLEKSLQTHQAEIEKKDKIIDEMAEEISKSIVNTCPFADYNVDLDCENKCKDDYKACWKQYFEYKVEEE